MRVTCESNVCFPSKVYSSNNIFYKFLINIKISGQSQTSNNFFHWSAFVELLSQMLFQASHQAVQCITVKVGPRVACSMLRPIRSRSPSSAHKELLRANNACHSCKLMLTKCSKLPLSSALMWNRLTANVAFVLWCCKYSLHPSLSLSLCSIYHRLADVNPSSRTIICFQVYLLGLGEPW